MILYSYNHFYKFFFFKKIQIDAFEMENYLREGYRLAQPQNCPDEL